MSIILGWLQLRAGSSWAPSLAHSGINYFDAPILAAVLPGAPALVAGIGGFVALPAYVLVAGWIVATGRLHPRSAALGTPVRPGAHAAALLSHHLQAGGQDDGLRAALEIRAAYPNTGMLVYAGDAPEDPEAGCGRSTQGCHT
jgi:hypothetical protein